MSIRRRQLVPVSFRIASRPHTETFPPAYTRHEALSQRPIRERVTAYDMRLLQHYRRPLDGSTLHIACATVSLIAASGKAHIVAQVCYTPSRTLCSKRQATFERTHGAKRRRCWEGPLMHHRSVRRCLTLSEHENTLQHLLWRAESVTRAGPRFDKHRTSADASRPLPSPPRRREPESTRH